MTCRVKLGTRITQTVAVWGPELRPGGVFDGIFSLYQVVL